MAEAHPTLPGTRIQDLTKMPPFGKWTVLSYAGKRGKAHYWLCRCECGKEAAVYGGNLKSGKSVQCKKHCCSHMSEHNIWKLIVHRCENPQSKDYERYGGRGIKVCDRWRESFQAFLEDVGPRPTPKHSIDRFPDNNGNYEPGNVRWATAKEQQRNTRANRMLTFNGVTKCMAAWADEKGINVTTVGERLRRGWSIERALTTPADLYHNRTIASRRSVSRC